jgi:dihydroorotase-like cyclic amidohydrolase
MSGKRIIALVVVLLISLQIHAEAQKTTVIRAETFYTVTRGIIQDGEILIRNGEIQAVGKNVQAPPDAEVHTAVAVIPGMIDAHTHLALDRSSRPPGPIRAERKAVDHVDLEHPMLRMALAGGVTSIVTRPGSGIICSGQAVALKLKGKSGPSKED